jgi:hypothetical protein
LWKVCKQIRNQQVSSSILLIGSKIKGLASKWLAPFLLPGHFVPLLSRLFIFRPQKTPGFPPQGFWLALMIRVHSCHAR